MTSFAAREIQREFVRRHLVDEAMIVAVRCDLMACLAYLANQRGMRVRNVAKHKERCTYIVLTQEL